MRDEQSVTAYVRIPCPCCWPDCKGCDQCDYRGWIWASQVPMILAEKNKHINDLESRNRRRKEAMLSLAYQGRMVWNSTECRVEATHDRTIW